jgi:hypothetical protein
MHILTEGFCIHLRGFPMTDISPVHASTLIVGKEGHTTTIAGEEDLSTHTHATQEKLQAAATTFIFGEETTTQALGEEVTTEAIGEEGPTTSGSGEENTASSFEGSRRGGPFGAY